MLYKFLVVSYLQWKTFHCFSSFKLQKEQKAIEDRLRSHDLELATLRARQREKINSNSQGCLSEVFQANQKESWPNCSLLLTAFGDQLDPCRARVMDLRSFIRLSSAMQGPPCLIHRH